MTSHRLPHYAAGLATGAIAATIIATPLAAFATPALSNHGDTYASTTGQNARVGNTPSTHKDDVSHPDTVGAQHKVQSPRTLPAADTTLQDKNAQESDVYTTIEMNKKICQKFTDDAHAIITSSAIDNGQYMVQKADGSTDIVSIPGSHSTYTIKNIPGLTISVPAIGNPEIIVSQRGGTW